MNVLNAKPYSLILKKLELHLESHKRIFDCNLCGMKFRSASNLENHKLLYHENKGHDCHKCGKKFISLELLEKHMCIYPNKNNKYECPVCGKEFNKTPALGSHMRVHYKLRTDINPDGAGDCPTISSAGSIQTVQKSRSSNGADGDQLFIAKPKPKPKLTSSFVEYECEDCNRKFTLVEDLNNHMCRAQMEKKYECPLCHKTFIRIAALGSHMKIHYKIKRELDTDADTAEIFKDAANEAINEALREAKIKASARTYTDSGNDDSNGLDYKPLFEKFECNDCGRKFMEEEDLIGHTCAAKLERKFKCEVCGAGFLRTTGLGSHLRTHRLKGETKENWPEVLAKKNAEKESKGNKIEFVNEDSNRSDGRFTENSNEATNEATTVKRSSGGFKGIMKCEVCGANFVRSCGLGSHLRTHRLKGETKENWLEILARKNAEKEGKVGAYASPMEFKTETADEIVDEFSVNSADVSVTENTNDDTNEENVEDSSGIADTSTENVDETVNSDTNQDNTKDADEPEVTIE